MRKYKQHHLWITSIYEHHDKNHELLVLSVPFPITDVPGNHQVMRPVLVSAVKTNPSEPYFHYPRIRLCANGENQPADLEDSYSPGCLADSLCITIAIDAGFNFPLSLLDFFNACQNAMLTKEEINCAYLPPFCVEWFRSRHPNIYLNYLIYDNVNF